MPATAFEPAHLSADRRRPRRCLAVVGVLVMVGAVVLPAGTSGAATTVELGTAESFGVLGASTVTNTGPTTIWGDLGVQSDAPDALTGFEDAVILGDTHAGGGSDAPDAQADALIAFGELASQPCQTEDHDGNLTGQDLGGLILEPGVYCFDSSAQLTGALTLNALADPAAVFIIRTASTLTTETASSVQFTDDFSTCNVFWQVGSSATLGTDTDFVGTVIAHTSITATTSATVEGRLIALNGAVTLDSNVITEPSCPAAVIPPPEDDTPVDDTPVDDTPVDDTPVDDTPVDDTPVDDTPVDETPVQEPADATPTDDTPVDEPPADGSASGASGGPLGGAPAVPESPTSGPAVPLSGGPAVPSVSGPAVPGVGGPAVPGVGGPDVPRPSLPATGSSLVLASYALLAIFVGCGLVTLTNTKRMTAR